jgi:hypothetical protein
MKYRTIVFLQGEEADEYLHILDTDGEEKTITALYEFDYIGEGDTSDEPPWGDGDDTYTSGPYVLAYNTRLGYISLTELMS